MKCFSGLVLCLLLGARAGAQPQSADSPTNTASVAGTVVKEPGSQPLKKVLLHLIAEDQKQGGNYTADTDSEGRFRFDKVEPGRYRLLLEKTGFHQINPRGHLAEGSALSAHAGEDIHDLLFQMLPSAVITGRVVDEDGDPLAGYGVSLLRKRPGKSREPELAGEERTNDLGEYRFPGLFPGQYLVAVVPIPDISNFLPKSKDPAEPAAKPDLSYLTTYYPGTTDSTQASVIDLRAGDEMPVNFTLVPARSYRIRGVVTGIPANQKPMVQLISRGVTQRMDGADVSTDGQFEIRGVAPGSYSITVFSGAEGQTLSARQNITVVASDVDGIKLLPTRPFTLLGHLRCEGQPPKDMTQYTVSLRGTDDVEGGSIYAIPGGVSGTQVDRVGDFRFTDLTPGSYLVQVYDRERPDTFLKWVSLGSSNADTGFRLTGPGSLELVVSSRGATLEGVALDKDQPASNATVVAVPEEKYRQLHDRYGIGFTDQNGHFTIRGLAPGRYTAFAWQDLDEGLYYDADFLKSQESNGTSLKVEEGSGHKIELHVSAVGDAWQ
jgi:protocatechuate 3,4-dioxygenase beta subunit